MTDRVAHQATAVAIRGRALLIEGDPGTGKSALAHALIYRGAVLIGDDGVMLDPRGDGLWAHPHPETRGLIEIRNVGIVTMPVTTAPVALVIELAQDAPRFVESLPIVLRAGRPLPLLRLWPDTPVLALRAEAGLARYGLPGAAR